MCTHWSQSNLKPHKTISTRNCTLSSTQTPPSTPQELTQKQPSPPAAVRRPSLSSYPSPPPQIQPRTELKKHEILTPDFGSVFTLHFGSPPPNLRPYLPQRLLNSVVAQPDQIRLGPIPEPQRLPPWRSPHRPLQSQDIP